MACFDYQIFEFLFLITQQMDNEKRMKWRDWDCFKTVRWQMQVLESFWERAKGYVLLK